MKFWKSFNGEFVVFKKTIQPWWKRTRFYEQWEDFFQISNFFAKTIIIYCSHKYYRDINWCNKVITKITMEKIICNSAGNWFWLARQESAKQKPRCWNSQRHRSLSLKSCTIFSSPINLCSWKSLKFLEWPNITLAGTVRIFFEIMTL